jgi:TetR/AcrR family transcriptional regulator, transcriptional repressor for nem operon
MRQPKITKENVLKEAKLLFNTKGYKSTSLRDITLATGYTKGAIYRHFENKDALEIEAFEQMMHTVFKIMNTAIQSKNNAKDKLFSTFDIFQNYVTSPYIKGGCPLLNVSIEVDDTNHPLKLKAQKALTILRSSIMTILLNGKKHNQVKLEVNENFVATIIIASLEGGIMMSKLQNNISDITIVVAHLKNWIEKELLI